VTTIVTTIQTVAINVLGWTQDGEAFYPTENLVQREEKQIGSGPPKVRWLVVWRQYRGRNLGRTEYQNKRAALVAAGVLEK